MVFDSDGKISCSGILVSLRLFRSICFFLLANERRTRRTVKQCVLHTARKKQ